MILTRETVSHQLLTASKSALPLTQTRPISGEDFSFSGDLVFSLGGTPSDVRPSSEDRSLLWLLEEDGVTGTFSASLLRNIT